VVALCVGFGEFFILYWVLAGLATYTILWVWDRNERTARSPNMPIIPFPSVTAIFSARRQVPNFARTRYPKSMSRTAKFHRDLDEMMWFIRLPFWVLMAPIVLLRLALPIRNCEMKWKMLAYWDSSRGPALRCFLNRIRDADGAFLNDVSAQAAAVQLGHSYTGLSKLLQVIAGLAQPHPPEHHFPNPEVAADKMIQWHTARDHVAAVGAGRKVGARFTLQGVEGLTFDERNFAARARVRRPCPSAVEVPVTLQPLAGNRTSFLDRPRRGGC
jgi:hypothetical protein